MLLGSLATDPMTGAELWLGKVCYSPLSWDIVQLPREKGGWSHRPFKRIQSRRLNSFLETSNGSSTPSASCLWLSLPTSQQKTVSILAVCCFLPGGGAWLLPSAAGSPQQALLGLVPALQPWDCLVAEIASKESPCPQCRGFPSACWIVEEGPTRTGSGNGKLEDAVLVLGGRCWNGDAVTEGLGLGPWRSKVGQALTTMRLRDTQQSSGKSCSIGTRNWRQPSQWHSSSIIPIRFTMRTTALARS